jgi:peptidyl-prolyl cis-trans isomerase SurA
MIIAPRSFGFRGTLVSAAALAAVVVLSFTTATRAQVSAPAAAARRVANFPDNPAIAYDANVDRLDALFPNGVVAVVQDRVITVADVRQEVAAYIARAKHQSRTQEEFNVRLAKLQDAAIKDLIERQLVIRRFHDVAPGDRPRTVAQEAVDTALEDELRERFGGDRAKFLEFLRSRNLTLGSYRKQIEENIIYQYMRSQERKVLPAPPPPRTAADAPLRLRMIQLTRTAGESDANLQERANAVLARLRNGESFESLAREFNEARQRERGGDMGWLGATDFRAEFRDAAMALKKGEVSAPIVISEGCFLLYAEDRR